MITCTTTLASLEQTMLKSDKLNKLSTDGLNKPTQMKLFCSFSVISEQLEQRYLCKELLLAEAVDPARVSLSGVQWLSSHLAANNLKHNYTNPLG